MIDPGVTASTTVPAMTGIRHVTWGGAITCARTTRGLVISLPLGMPARPQRRPEHHAHRHDAHDDEQNVSHEAQHTGTRFRDSGYLPPASFRTVISNVRVMLAWMP